MAKRSKLDEKIRKVLSRAPIIEGYTVKQVADLVGEPWPTIRWHLEMMEARELVDYIEVGRAKVFHLKKKVNKR